MSGPVLAGALYLHKAALGIKRAINWVDTNAGRIIDGIKMCLVAVGLFLAGLAAVLLNQAAGDREAEAPGL